MENKIDFSPTGFTYYFQKLIEIDLKHNERATNMLVWYLVVLTAIQGLIANNLGKCKLSVIFYCILAVLIIVYRLIEYLSTNSINVLNYLFLFQLMEMKSRGEFKEFENPDLLIKYSTHFKFTSLKRSIQNGDFLEAKSQVLFQTKYKWVKRYSKYLDILMWLISGGVIIYIILISYLLS